MRLYDNQPAGTIARARALRRGASDPERRLLGGLKEAFAWLKWRHQAPLGSFFADILCFSQRLAIEVDGDTHAGTVTEDASRTHFIEAQGYRGLRFSNADVMQNLEGVLQQISFCLREKEGAHAKHGKDEGDQKGKGETRASPSLFRRCAAPSLSRGERE